LHPVGEAQNLPFYFSFCSSLEERSRLRGRVQNGAESPRFSIADAALALPNRRRAVWFETNFAHGRRIFKAVKARTRASALAVVATQCANTGDEHADNPADKHGFAENIMPVAHLSHQQHRAADHESSESDGTREPSE